MKNRTFFIALLAYGLVIAGLVTLQAPPIAMALPLLIYLIGGLVWAPGEIQVRAERSLSTSRIQIGQAIRVTLTVTNEGPLLEEALLEDVLPPGLEIIDGSSRRLVRLARGASVTWTYTLRGKRGSYTLNRLQITAKDVLGLVTIRRAIDTHGQLFILPPVLRLRRVAIRPLQTRVYSGSIPARQGGSGVEFFDVREYQSGDSPHWINWRVTARDPLNMYSNQFEQERVAEVGIILDGRRRTNEFGQRSIFEHSILATAALADAFLNTGNRVGMLFYGKNVAVTFPGYGKIQEERLLHDLSRLEPGDSVMFSELVLPRKLFAGRAQLVLVSPLIAEDYPALAALRMKGYPLLVVSPDPVAFELQGTSGSREDRLAARLVRIKRALLLKRLAGAGIQVVEWDVSVPFEHVARQTLERHPALPRGAQR